MNYSMLHAAKWMNIMLLENKGFVYDSIKYIFTDGNTQ